MSRWLEIERCGGDCRFRENRDCLTFTTAWCWNRDLPKRHRPQRITIAEQKADFPRWCPLSKAKGLDSNLYNDCAYAADAIQALRAYYKGRGFKDVQDLPLIEKHLRDAMKEKK